ncbi:GON-4-like protein [Leptotrombidium deliense]|uniref:GON-4-like protein n=1 Tax=Leptotrombidium deliense TaxID=299467 RepID=A0A443SI78_9ACAR|nr:GON-4-like protein [Leptotrombidium deliense]
MVKNIITNNENDCDFEPKLTRSKLRQAQPQKEEDEEEECPLFVELEDEDDEEYKPVEDEEDDDDLEEEVDDTDAASNANKSELDSEAENEPVSALSESDLICLRTRSKCHIEQVPSDTLEFPDVSKDLYGENSDNVDEDWKQFLDSLYVDNPSKMLEDDETNDPEYNVFEDIEDLFDSWDLRDDKAVKVSNKEVKELMGDDVECCDPKELVKADSISALSCSLSNEDMLLLHHQMSQHVQLLTQTYFLTVQNSTLSSVSESAKFLLNEISQFTVGKNYSFFRTVNLSDAVKIIDEAKLRARVELKQSTSWRPCPLSKEAKSIIAKNPNVFQFPSLLPLNGYFDVLNSEKKKTVFTAAEDALIALGLEQFKPLEKRCYKYIRQLLVPIKSELQIRIHVKNLKRSKKAADDANPIKYYLRTGQTLPVSRNYEVISSRSEYSEGETLPEWLKKELSKQEKSLDSLAHHNYCLKSSKSQLQSTPVKPIQPKPRSAVLSPFKQVSSIIKKYKMYKPSNRLPVLKLKDSNETDGKNNVMSDEVSSTSEVREENEKCQTSKEVTDNELSDDGNRITDLTQNASEMDAKVDDEDNESDLEALMLASSTITSSKMRSNQNFQSKREGKKVMAAKHRESTALILSENWNENDSKKAEKEDVLVEHFLARVREVLTDNQDYVQFLTYLNEFGVKRSANSTTGLKELYKNIESLLLKVNASDVLDEFVLFLQPHEAALCGKTFDYLYWRRFTSFIRKLEVYFCSDSTSLFRLYKVLWQMKQNDSSVDKKKLRNAISKIVNNQPYLMHEFSSLFLDEKPSDHLFANDEDFDEIQVTSDEEENENANTPKEYVENINLSVETEDLKYGTNECPCKLCHNDNTEITKKRHCIACSIKFIGGKVYLQGHKKPQLAEIHYNDCGQKQCTANSESVKTVSSDSESENMSKKQNDKNDSWSINDDKLLLELCKSKIISGRNQSLGQEVFEEVAAQLQRDTKSIIIRFQQLIEIFKKDKSGNTGT